MISIVAYNKELKLTCVDIEAKVPVQEIIDWARANCGGYAHSSGAAINPYTFRTIHRFWFHYPEDATFFSLRWK